MSVWCRRLIYARRHRRWGDNIFHNGGGPTVETVAFEPEGISFDCNCRGELDDEFSSQTKTAQSKLRVDDGGLWKPPARAGSAWTGEGIESFDGKNYYTGLIHASRAHRPRPPKATVQITRVNCKKKALERARDAGLISGAEGEPAPAARRPPPAAAPLPPPNTH
ncbi:hypothetical protein EVAR_35403_1 [Eumeta japonica]|uniref:Uncharacterized protein n=1 Tax=Eumeta variegata TaxID=151549 RepID=A0A4C1XF82_EUMVA|nr:hypothetical protein EVAR_35403_1 [Eumeta japonica]